MTYFLDLLIKIFDKFAPAIAVIINDYQEGRIARANAEKEKAKTELEVEKNHAQVDANNAGKSDVDIVNDAIVSGGGSGQLEESAPTEPTPTPGNPTGDKKSNGST